MNNKFGQSNVNFDRQNNPHIGDWLDNNMHGNGVYTCVGKLAEGREKVNIRDHGVLAHSSSESQLEKEEKDPRMKHKGIIPIVSEGKGLVQSTPRLNLNLTNVDIQKTERLAVSLSNGENLMSLGSDIHTRNMKTTAVASSHIEWPSMNESSAIACRIFLDARKLS